MSKIPEEYLYFKPKDVAAMAVDVASDILVSDVIMNKEFVKHIMNDPKYLKRFQEIAALINNCGKDIADLINKDTSK